MESKSEIVSVIAVVSLLIISCILAINIKGNDAKSTISVSGTSELSVAPDKAEIYINVITLEPSANKSQEKNKLISQKVMEALKNSGIKESDIETSNYYLTKKQDWDPKNQEYTDRGYELVHTLKVTTISVEKAGNIVDIAIAAGANGVDRVLFGLTKDTEKNVRSDALAKATVAAKEKAASIAQNSGVKLGKISSIQESNTYYQPYIANIRNTYSKDIEDAMGSSIIAPQKVEITSSIQINFEIA